MNKKKRRTMKDKEETTEECEHVLDLNSVSNEYEKGTVYVNVNCSKCGDSGTVAMITKETEVDW